MVGPSLCTGVTVFSDCYPSDYCRSVGGLGLLGFGRFPLSVIRGTGHTSGRKMRWDVFATGALSCCHISEGEMNVSGKDAEELMSRDLQK